MNEQERLIFHIDVNSAFLSWEAVRRVQNGEPDLRLVPSAVGGDPNSRRSIIVAKSIPAKKYNVVTGEPVALALKKCPELIVVKPDFTLYSRCSRAFKKICRDYAPVVEEFSIDECFLDFTGTSRIYPDSIALAYEIKDKIKTELGFTVNVGIGRNKLCAKMASDFEKPDKVHTLFPDEIQTKMWPLPVGDLLFVGKSSVRKLNDAHIFTIGDLAVADPAFVAGLLGTKMSEQSIRYANGLDDSPVQSQPREAKGYSNEITVEDDITTFETANAILLALADSVTAHMRREDKKAYGVSVTVRYLDFKKRSHQCTLDHAVDTSREVYEVSKKLLAELWKDRRPLRLMGISLTNLTTDSSGDQFSLFDTSEEIRERDGKVDRTVDELRKKYGRDIMKRGSVMSLGIHTSGKTDHS